MNKKAIAVECAQCQHEALIEPSQLDAFRCPSCQWINWMEVYALSRNDCQFLRSIRVDPETVRVVGT